ncbi:MAG: DUF2505 domain-containing protein [Myxococcales bacterium]
MPTARTIHYEYPANPDQIIALLKDPAFLKRRCEAAGERDVDVRVEPTSDGVRVVIAREKTIDIPAFARRLFEPTHRAVESTAWSRKGDRWVADYTVEVQGFPGKVSGRSTLTPSSSGCHYESTFEITARVPLIGGKIEGLLADGLAEQLVVNAQRNESAL